MIGKCPKCDFDNTPDSKFCKECGTQLPPPQDHPPVMTETLQTPLRELTTGSTFAGLKLVERKFGLRPLTPRDAEANDMLDCFDFKQIPLTPVIITKNDRLDFTGFGGSKEK
jgi:hypothetical protein